MSFLTKLIIIPALLAIVRSEFPFELDTELDFDFSESRSEDSSLYRLPEELDTVHTDLEITPYFETAPAGKTPFSFDGIATLQLKTLRPGLTSLVIQDNVREIVSFTLKTASGVVVETTGFERIREYHRLKINLREGLTLGDGEVYFLTIEYIGNMNETPLTRGMFRGSYKDNDGKLHWYAATHLQPTHGRQLLPCLDEPGYKSTYDIIVNRPAHFTETFSNMRIKQTIENGDRVKEIFNRTPRMSAYLITIHISEQFKVLADNGDKDRSYRIIGRPNAEGQGAYALQVGPPLTKWFEEYFGIGYYTMEEGMKNDQIACPDWASGATENWGLVSYRELRLLSEEGETNAVDKMTVGTITAHELAHKWFGNYITAKWWDNVWVNEGFASYFEYFAMDAVDPNLELADQFNIMYLQSALSSDSSTGTRALRHTVNSPTEVTGHFSGISYTKGASLLLMLKNLLSEATFKKALTSFLQARAKQEAEPEHLYVAFTKAASDAGGVIGNTVIADFMRIWVDEPGYPVLNVNVDMGTGVISLKQERFFISSSAAKTKQLWPIPLTYTTGRNPDWDNVTPSRVMQGEEDKIEGEAGHHWVIFNVQQKGMYRVNYDAHNWEMLASALKRNVSSIHHLNRAQIVDDVFALMRSERMSFALGFQVLEFLKDDTSYYSWYPAITGFSWLRNRLLHLPEALAKFDDHLHEYLEAVIKHLGYDVISEPHSDTLNRFYTMTFACNVGHKGCLEDAAKKFAAFKAGTSVNPNVRRHVFCEGLRAGGYEDWSLLYQRRLRSNNQADEAAMLRALGCTADGKAVEEYIDMLLSDNVKAQDRANGFTFLYAGHRNNAKTALPILKKRLGEIRKAVILPASFNAILSNTASYLDEEGLVEMENWLRSESSSIPEHNIGLNAIASARTSMKWGSDRADQILAAIPVPGSAATLVPTLTILLASLLAIMLR